MAQIVFCNLDDPVKQGLKQQAQRHGHSMEEEVRNILRNAVRAAEQPPLKLGTRIAERFAGHGLDTELPELRAICAISPTSTPTSSAPGTERIRQTGTDQPALPCV